MIKLKDRNINEIHVKMDGVVRKISKVYLKDVLVYSSLPAIPTYLLASPGITLTTPTNIGLELLINLTYRDVTDTTLTLDWTAADTSGGKVVEFYEVLENGLIIGSTTGNTVGLSNRIPGNTYIYKVRAQYTDDSFSSYSNEVTVNMLP